MKVFAMLQNAWAHEAMEQWNYESWVKAMRKSRSGKRLDRIFSAQWAEVVFANTTPRVGEGPDSKLPPDTDYVRELLRKHMPDVVVTFGEQAERVAMDLWPGFLLVLPHPAYRLLSNTLLDLAQRLLFGEANYEYRMALRQGRGIVSRETL